MISTQTNNEINDHGYSPINNNNPPYNKTPRSIKDLKTQNNKTPGPDLGPPQAKKKLGFLADIRGETLQKRTILGVRIAKNPRKKTQNNKTPKSIRIQNLDFLILRGGVYY